LTILVALFFSSLYNNNNNNNNPHIDMANDTPSAPLWAYTGLEDGGARNEHSRHKFSSVVGFFLQDDPDTDDKGFEYVRAAGHSL